MKLFSLAAGIAASALLFVGATGGALAETSGTAASAYVPTACGLMSNLARGSHGASVASLQDFLRDAGYFSEQSIGIFGPKTFNAVVAFQRANNLPPTGFVGMLTRALIREKCGTTPPVTGNVRIYTMTPRSGPVGTEVTIDGFGFTSDNTVHFGSGVVMHVPAAAGIAISCTNDPACVPGIHQTLTFLVPEGINPPCFYSNPRCLIATRQTVPGAYDVAIENANGRSNSKTFTVTGDVVASTPQITSLSPAAAGAGEHVDIIGSNLREGAVLHLYRDGEPYGSLFGLTVTDSRHASFLVPEWIGAYCHVNSACIALAKSLPAGTYAIAVETTDGTSNPLTFTKTGGAISSGTLSINGLDAPTTLSMGTSGTWAVHVTTSSASPNLHYAVYWGDEEQAVQSGIMAPASSAAQASATFTHVYQRAGTYTPTFTVTDDEGHSASTSATVTVIPWY